jgi:hypothetical protein
MQHPNKHTCNIRIQPLQHMQHPDLHLQHPRETLATYQHLKYTLATCVFKYNIYLLLEQMEAHRRGARLCRVAQRGMLAGGRWHGPMSSGVAPGDRAGGYGPRGDAPLRWRWLLGAVCALPAQGPVHHCGAGHRN